MHSQFKILIWVPNSTMYTSTLMEMWHTSVARHVWSLCCSKALELLLMQIPNMQNTRTSPKSIITGLVWPYVSDYICNPHSNHSGSTVAVKGTCYHLGKVTNQNEATLKPMNHDPLKQDSEPNSSPEHPHKLPKIKLHIPLGIHFLCSQVAA